MADPTPQTPDSPQTPEPPHAPVAPQHNADDLPPHVRTLVDFTLVKLDEIIDAVGALDDATANAVPPAPGANSPFVLLTHCLGMMRRWSSTVNLGIRVPRDRDAEFSAIGRVADLLISAAEVRAAFLADLTATDWNSPPVAPATGYGPWSQSTLGVLLHVFEELCQHLGHLEITLDLLRAPDHRAAGHRAGDLRAGNDPA
ncbi:DinB family protein [Brevibacterium pityocampae]